MKSECDREERTTPKMKLSASAETTDTFHQNIISNLHSQKMLTNFQHSIKYV